MGDDFTYDVPPISVATAVCVHVRIWVDGDGDVRSAKTIHDWWPKFVFEMVGGGSDPHDERFYERLDQMEVPV